jgi:carboxymethylenebutenolidase
MQSHVPPDGSRESSPEFSHGRLETSASLASAGFEKHFHASNQEQYVSSRMVEFRANGRTAEGYLSLPEGKGPGLVLLQEWWGLVDHIKDLADRFAREGFVVLAPDLYHGDKTKSPDQAGKMLMALNIGEAAKDMRGAARYLLEMQEVEPRKVGVMGFCMGGQLALYAATEFPDEISAGVDFYGIHPNAQIDPSKLRVPILAHFANRDDNTPVESARALIDSIEAAGKSIEAHFYEADHAFFNDTRPEVYDAGAAGLAWERTLAFLRKNLS